MEPSPTDPSFLSILINWLPFVIWIGVVIYIARVVNRYVRERSKYQSAALEQITRQTSTLERIAAAIEQRK